jgi:hypothetical protein
MAARGTYNKEDITVSPELEEWFRTKGKELEQKFIGSFLWSISQAEKRGVKVNVEGLINHLRLTLGKNRKRSMKV